MPFDASKIERAVYRALAEVLSEDPDLNFSDAERIARLVTFRVAGRTLNVEKIQDFVEEELMANGLHDAARAYILYRAEHAAQRDARPIPDDVRAAFDADKKYFPTPLQRWNFMDKYSRWSEEKGRRETWVETVDRMVDALRRLAKPYADLGDETYDRIRTFILEMKAMPSMRLLAMAGPAYDRSSMTGFNCAYLPASDLLAFKETLLLSMSGCGVGFSVERKYVDQIGVVSRQKGEDPLTWVVEDSTEGWADALLYGLETWFSGGDVVFDDSLVRPAGSPLRVKGGRASGPEPLRAMLSFARSRILSRQGKTLRPIDAHDIMCAVGQAAVSGGVRRTALISLFDADDHEMLTAKSGDFERENSQRWNANNSAVWTGGGLTQIEFMRQFMAMVESGRGEPGFFSRDSVRAMRPSHRGDSEFGVNPCGEAVLRPYGLCNLSAAVARRDDTFESLREKVEIATIIGTIQSLGTNFPGFRPEWKKNAEEERLLGVDITGQMDCPLIYGDGGDEVMRKLRSAAWATNREYAKKLGVNVSASITVVKPSGNTSVLVNCASGLHARWSPYQIKRVRVAASSAMYKVLRDSGVPLRPENGQTEDDATTWVASFPLAAPEGAITRKDRTAIQQCEHWKRNKLNWTTHNPSVTVTYRPDEIIEIMHWMWDNRDIIGGMSFLPADDAHYEQLPNEEVTKERYDEMVRTFPDIKWDLIYRYEQKDMTTASQELACVAGLCEV